MHLHCRYYIYAWWAVCTFLLQWFLPKSFRRSSRAAHKDAWCWQGHLPGICPKVTPCSTWGPSSIPCTHCVFSCCRKEVSFIDNIKMENYSIKTCWGDFQSIPVLPPAPMEISASFPKSRCTDTRHKLTFHSCLSYRSSPCSAFTLLGAHFASQPADVFIGYRATGWQFVTSLLW